MGVGASKSDSPSRRYSIGICKGAGLIADTRMLADRWRPGETAADFIHRAMKDGFLGRYTEYRARDILRRVFARRYMVPDSRPVALLKTILTHRLPARTFTEAVFLYSCRADPLIRDFAVNVLWPAELRGRSYLSVEDTLAFLADAAAAGHIPTPWSLPVQKKIGRGLLGMLRDVGLVRETTRTGPREIVPYEMSDEGIAILARELHEQGLTDSSVCEHPDWQLWGMDRGGVLERMHRLGDSRALVVQHAGSVVRMTWKVSSMEELVHALAR